jgi:hypothetical protein
MTGGVWAHPLLAVVTAPMPVVALSAKSLSAKAETEVKPPGATMTVRR